MNIHHCKIPRIQRINAEVDTNFLWSALLLVAVEDGREDQRVGELIGMITWTTGPSVPLFIRGEEAFTTLAIHQRGVDNASL
jgi:hypothetical protein